MFLVIGLLVAFVAGSWFGWFLAKHGVTADNALQRHQRQVYLIGSVVLGAGTLITVLMISERQSPWFPSFLLLYVGAYFWHFVLFICCFFSGLLLLLEQPGWKQRQRLQQLILFLGVSLSAICFLLYQSLPITDLVEPARISEGVVLQTTSYSCSAATIATLARRVNPALQTTEMDVVKLAGTSRQGTSTLAEIHAMQALGLAPQYERNLTIAELVHRNQMAVLHVMEPVSGTKIQHAIALLEINAAKGTLTVANPLYGKQVKTFDEMKNYWIGEAVFITALPNAW